MAKYYDIDPNTCSIEELKETITKLQGKVGYYSALEQGCKRFINSVYGALGSKFYNCSNKDIAESITLQGQDLIKFSVRCVNNFFKDPNKWVAQVDAHHKIAQGMKQHFPDFDVDAFLEKCKLPLDFGDTCQVYGDSCTGDTVIEIKRSDMMSESISIEELFNMFISTKEDLRGKEFVTPTDISVNHYCGGNQGCVFGLPSHIIRHKTDKDIYEVKTAGHSVKITEDHSLYVLKKDTPSNERFCQHAEELSPKDIEVGDLLIGHMGSTNCLVEVISVEYVGKTDDYVYDIEMKDAKGMGHSFFGNGLLLHNTDSVSANSIIRTEKHPRGITIEEFYNENINNIGDTTLAGHECVTTDDKVLNYYPNDPIKMKILEHTEFEREIDKYDHYGPVKRIIRHKVTKPKWKIYSAQRPKDVFVECTGDHSLMIERDSDLIPIRPIDIQEHSISKVSVGVYYEKGDRLKPYPSVFMHDFAKAEQIGMYEDEYVYDIEMDDDTHTFYCNDVLVHNSAYITLDFLLKTCGITEEQSTRFIMEFYTNILKEYLGWCFGLYAKSYNCPVNLEEFELEKVARSVIMLRKKKYVMDISWREGKTAEGIYEKPLHKLVIKGVEIVKGESSLFCRQEMKNFVIWLLQNVNENNEIKYSEIIKRIKEIKTRFSAMHPNEICKNQSISDYDKYIKDDKREGGVIFKENLTITMPAKAVAKYNNLLYTSAKKYRSKYNIIHSGDKVKLYYIKQTRDEEKANPNAAFAFLPGNFPSEFAPPMDIDKQFNLLILGPLNRFIVAMGYPEVRENLRYTTSLF